MKKTVLLLLAAGLLGVLGFQYRQIVQVRDKNRELSFVAYQKLAVSPVPVSGPEDPEVAAEIARLRETNRDLLKLRNQVRFLHEQQSEYEALRVENERLRALGSTNPAAKAQLSTAPVFVLKENLSNQGFLTPEATVQTFYWAQRESNAEVFASCLLPGRQTGYDFDYSAQDMAEKTAIEFVARRNRSADTVQLGLRVHGANDLSQAVWTLKLVGNEWKLDLDPKGAGGF